MMNTLRIDTIYLDMDGVLCDFEKRYHELFGILPDRVHKKDWSPKWEQFIKQRNFETLEWHIEGIQLYSGVLKLVKDTDIKIEILTSSGGPLFFEEVSEQKKNWLTNNNINYHVNVVPGKKHKQFYASPHKILIDDLNTNIIEFQSNNGIAIHHTGNANATLSLLKSYLS